MESALINSNINSSLTAAADAQQAAAVASWLESLDLTECTKKQYRSSVKHFLRYMQAHAISSKADIVEFKASLQSAGLKPSTINLAIIAAKSFFTFICESMPTNAQAAKIAGLVCKMKSVKRNASAHKREALTAEEAKKLIAAVDCSKSSQVKEKELRDSAIVNLLLRCGLRTIELSRANIEDIKSMNGQAVLYIQGKGRSEKDAFVILPAAAMAALNKYLEARGASEGPLFIACSNRNRGQRLDPESIQAAAKNALRAIGIDSPAYTAHSLRHTAITLALLGGADLMQAQAMARHANINTTLIYAHNLQRISNAAELRIDAMLTDRRSGGRRICRKFRHA